MKKYLLLNRQDRIGHLFHEMYNYYANYEKQLCLIILNPKNVANQQLYKMWLRKFDLENINYLEIDNKLCILLFKILKKITHKLGLTFDDDMQVLNAKRYYDTLKKSKYILGSTTFDGFENKLFNVFDLTLKFTNDEEQIGQKFLEKHGLVEKEFVVFHSRDGEYLKEDNLAYHEFRNVDFASFTKAISWLDNQNVKTLRFGVSSKKVNSSLLNNIETYIDYAKDLRTDFLDMFLVAKARYFVGNSSGPFITCSFFNKPVIITNFIPIDILLTKEGDIFMWKKLVDKSTNKLLSLEYILKNKIFFRDTKQYINSNIEIIDNTDDEILEACKEMEAQLNNIIMYNTKEDLQILEDFMSLMNEYLPNVLVLGKPSLNFLKSYPLKEAKNV